MTFAPFIGECPVCHRSSEEFLVRPAPDDATLARIAELERENAELHTVFSVMSIENAELRKLLIECRSSVKFDQNRYERMALDFGRLRPEGAQTHATSEAEAQRLYALLDAIDAAIQKEKENAKRP